MKPTLHTERFTLYPWNGEEKYTKHLVEMMQSQEVQKYIRGHAYSDEEVVESLTKIKQNNTDKFGIWMIYEVDICIGMCLLKTLPTKAEPKLLETGYWLKPAHWGKAIAAEVASRMVKYAFDDLNLECVVAVTHQDNIASQKSLQKAGLKRQGNINAYEQDLPFFKITNPNHKKSNKPTLHTERLTLLPWVDCGTFKYHMIEMMQNADVQKYVYEHVLSATEMAAQLDQMTEVCQLPDLGYWIIYEADTCIGMALLKPAENKLCEYWGEVGYWIKPQFWGKAIAAEAATALVKYGFEVVKLDLINAITHSANIGSQKSLLKAGLKRQGHKAAIDSRLPSHNQICPYFEIRAADYQANS
ncbi:MAG: GNAT family N-acetyltransferase [OCS116 cluster bacterium]|nr:GNAT family N-acetyltransferase [OCS116 cluster bacterium]